jgi:hypothetical protein
MKRVCRRTALVLAIGFGLWTVADAGPPGMGRRGPGGNQGQGPPPNMAVGGAGGAGGQMRGPGMGGAGMAGGGPGGQMAHPLFLVFDTNRDGGDRSDDSATRYQRRWANHHG